MKKLNIAAAILSVLLLINSCSDDFLVKSSPDALAADGYFSSAERAESGVNAIYKSLQQGWKEDVHWIQEVPSGDIRLFNTQPLEYNSFTYDASLTEIHGCWTELYEGINRANLVITNVPQIDMDESSKSRYVGEAKFLRALFYFTLTKLYGGVPLVIKPLDSTADALIARSSKNEVYDVIIQDLKDAIESLPMKSSYSNENLGRANWGAATALLGKVHLYAKNFNKAEEMFKKVIDSHNYELMDGFQHIWNRNYENNKESLFEVQYSVTGEIGGNDYGHQLPAVNGGGGSYLPSQEAVNTFKNDDPRLGYSVFRDGDTFAPQIDPDLATFKAEWSATNYAVKKGMIPIKYVNGDGGNYLLIRYADVLLMYAEAANELGMQKQARDAINQVRQRPSVDMPKLTVAETDTYEKMFNAIVHERHVELMFEYKRFNDLRRWGLAEEELGDIGYAPRDSLFPIPQLELDINPKLDQNPGWGQ